ncbi:hypothetical protein AR158_c628R [Paramecium bursaria Chlorella virus AR158]|uniref:hypothetical protein n=1 Tax=Paramecium bursaria Chlorella virus AR158 TaxID=380598 RepID=UPI00015AA7F4|nr:hypothetical protein AR158_c628R [Paramecium bursaria Chlorella virus AR158]ABU44173.1 hypothetical protein AR158_c628R [Paramecium bursaria Chlorella virus AR158]
MSVDKFVILCYNATEENRKDRIIEGRILRKIWIPCQGSSRHTQKSVEQGYSRQEDEGCIEFTHKETQCHLDLLQEHETIILHES